MNTSKADALIKALGMRPLPGEGGMYAETYRSNSSIPANALPPEFDGPRSVCTGIYYLVRPGDFSAFHRLRSDEMWHFYQGDPLEVCVIEPTGKLVVHTLGPDFQNGEVHQAVVPDGSWFGSRLKPGTDGSGYGLVGCTVSPGFEYADFELGTAAQLLEQFPQHREWIAALTRS